MNPGWFQWVTPGRMIFWKSCQTASGSSGLFGHGGGKLCRDLAGFDLRQHRHLPRSTVEIVGDPLHHPVALAAEEIRVPLTAVAHGNLRTIG